MVYCLLRLRTGDAGGEGDPGQDNEQRNLPKFSNAMIHRHNELHAN